MKRWVAIACVLWPIAARAHGGLPISLGILRDQHVETMIVPVIYWGVWVGTDGGPWRWICEEAINDFRTRKYALSPDGTFYATNQRGLNVSKDHGCTWLAVRGEIAEHRVTTIAVDPSDGAVAWATTDDTLSLDPDGGAPMNGLYVTRNRGDSFERVAALEGSGRRFLGLAIAPSDARTIYVTSTASTQAEPAIHRSTDGGASFTSHPITWTLDGAVPYATEVMAVDPRHADVVYVRAYVTSAGLPYQVLLRSIDGGVQLAEVHRLVGEKSPSGFTRGLDAVAVDATHGKVFLATKSGVLVGDDVGRAPTLTFSPTGNLTLAQCLEARDGVLYACSSNYSPDFAALARSDDQGATFRSILSYQDTVGPIEICPGDTPVARMCPSIWLSYRDQLGIVPLDGGTSGNDPGGCACTVGAHPSLPLGVGFFVLFAAGIIIRRNVRRRSR